MMSGTEKNNDFQFQLIAGVPNKDQLNTLLTLYKTIFIDARSEFFKERLFNKQQVLAIIAFKNKGAIGFKIGYKYNRTTFYSWVGGVTKNYRNQGVARQLAQHQEHWAKNKGYSKLRTKSMNRFKSMMILNLKNGFDIKSVYTNDSGQTKIIFEKDI